MSVLNNSRKHLSTVAIVLSIFGLGASLISTSPALATSYGSSSDATISGSVSSVPTCGYSLSGVSASVALTASGTYNPDKPSGTTTLTGSDSDITISGFPNGTINAECSFYGSAPSAPKMKVNLSPTPTWSGTCTSCGVNYKIGWSVNSSNPIVVTPSQSSAGGAGTTNDCSSGGITLSSATLTTTTSSTLVAISSSTPKQCDAAITISTGMPSGMNDPAGQRAYTVTGPTLTYTYSGS